MNNNQPEVPNNEPDEVNNWKEKNETEDVSSLYCEDKNSSKEEKDENATLSMSSKITLPILNVEMDVSQPDEGYSEDKADREKIVSTPLPITYKSIMEDDGQILNNGQSDGSDLNKIKEAVLSEETLPEFDPEKFTPGYVPKIVTKGNEDYMIVVSGIRDTGLCGEYWGSPLNLGSKRTSKPRESLRLENFDKKRKSQSQTLNVKLNDDEKQVVKRKSFDTVDLCESDSDVAMETPKARRGRSKGRGKGRKTNNIKSAISRGKQKSRTFNVRAGTDGQPRFASCDDPSTNKEVAVECFSPYEDNQWFDIGKAQNHGSRSDSDDVQYSRALRPPYHLLSFLRIKSQSSKGMSCTDKNTMVFVVIEGEITVRLHTTNFKAKKKDSFYIPPKNYYDLINDEDEDAELSLTQFQYDGPLPTYQTTSCQNIVPNGHSS